MDHVQAMGEALLEARACLRSGDVPVGAVVLVDGEITARGRNERELRGDPTAHAEILALREAARAMGTWRLTQAELIVTIEPCAMCAGAAVAARIKRLVYGAADEKAGAVFSLYNLVQDPRLNHSVEVVAGVRAAEASEVISDFFARRRLQRRSI